jgi:hypothetical protein
MLAALGEGYVTALREAYEGAVPDGSDYVLYWWHRAARLVAEERVKRFGLITTNSVAQKFNRRVVEAALSGPEPLSIVFGIPDHPWVDTSDGAAVRIAMTVGAAGRTEGTLASVVHERPAQNGEVAVEVHKKRGMIHANLRIGADVSAALPLRANEEVCGTGLILGGRGFVLSRVEAEHLLSLSSVYERLIFPLKNGKDLTDVSREAFVLDTAGWSERELLSLAPEAYQRLKERVFPERQENRDPRLRENWWLFRRSNEQIRRAIANLDRFIATPETAKHRFWVFLDTGVRPEHRLVVVGSPDATVLACLSSRLHLVWALAAGGTLEDRPVYNKTRCFDAFPFPVASEVHWARIREFGEQLDSHRKRQQSLHAGLTITGMYNVLEKLRSGEALTAKEMDINKQGLVAVLKQIHDDLDAAVFEAYGWPSTLTDEEILERLVALNAERAEEERRGLVRWLRPEFQDPGGAKTATQESLEGAGSDAGDETPAIKPAAALPWPKALPEKIAAVRDLLQQGRAQSLESIRASFAGAKPKELRGILDSLAALGLAVAHGESGETAWSGGGRPAGAGGTV